MARIELDLAHSYKPNPQADADYALLPLQMTFADSGAYALLGPSGCGKTTLLNIVSGLLAPSQGRVLFDGADVSGEDVVARVERGISIVPEQRELLRERHGWVFDAYLLGQNQGRYSNTV